MATLYLSKGAGGNNSGSSWANAFNEANQVSGLNPGDVLLIDGGTSKIVYDTTLNLESGATYQLASDPGRDGYAVIYGGGSALPHSFDTSFTGNEGDDRAGINYGSTTDTVVDGRIPNGITVEGFGSHGLDGAVTGANNSVWKYLGVHRNSRIDGVSGTYRTPEHGAKFGGDNIEIAFSEFLNNGQDAFQGHGGGSPDNMDIHDNLFGNNIAHKTKPRLTSNYREHNDGVQVFTDVTGMKIRDNVMGGFWQVVIMPDAGTDANSIEITGNVFFYSNTMIRFHGNGNTNNAVVSNNIFWKWETQFNDAGTQTTGGQALYVKGTNNLFDSNLWVHPRGVALVSGANFTNNYKAGTQSGDNIPGTTVSTTSLVQNPPENGDSIGHVIAADWDTVDFTIINASVAGQVGQTKYAGPLDWHRKVSGVNYLDIPKAIQANGDNDPRYRELSDKSISTGVPFSYQPDIRHPDGSPMTITASNVPPGLSIDANSGELSGTPTTPGTYDTILTASDGSNSIRASFQIVVGGSNSNNPPVIDTIPNQTSLVGDSVLYSIVVNDIDGDPTTCTVTGLPPGIVYNAGSKSMAGSPNTAGSFNVQVVCSDNQGASDTENFVWTVNDVGNTPPAIDQEDDVCFLPGQTVSIDLGIADADGDSFTCSVTGLPTGLTLAQTAGVPETVDLSTGTIRSGSESSSGAIWDFLTNLGNPFSIALTTQGVGTNPGAPSHVIAATLNGLLDFESGGAAGYPINKQSRFTFSTSDPVNTFKVFAFDVDNQPDGNGNISEFLSDFSGTGFKSAEGDQVTTTIDYPSAGGGQVFDFIWNSIASGNHAGFGYSSLQSGTIELSAGTLGSCSIEGVSSDVGDHTVVVSASDSAGSSDMTFIISINGDPIIDTIADISINPGDAVNQVIAITDPNASQTHLCTVTGLPAGITYNDATKTISGSSTVEGIFEIVVNCSDGCGGSDEEIFTLTIGGSNNPPIITPIEDHNFEVGDLVAITTMVVDADGDTPVCAATGLPSELSFIQSSGVIQGTATTPGIYTVTIICQDGQGGTDQEEFTLTIVSPDNEPPTITNPLDQTSIVNQQHAVFINVTDPEGDTVTCTVSGIPSGTAYDPLTGFITGVPSMVGTYFVTVNCQDSNGNLSSESFSWEVQPEDQNFPPDIVPIGQVNSTVGETANITIQTSDPDGDMVSCVLEGLPPGTSYNAATGQIIGAPIISGNYTVSVTCSDGQGGQDVESFIWVVTDPGGQVDPDVFICYCVVRKTETAERIAAFSGLCGLSAPNPIGGTFDEPDIETWHHASEFRCCDITVTCWKVNLCSGQKTDETTETYLAATEGCETADCTGTIVCGFYIVDCNRNCITFTNC